MAGDNLIAKLNFFEKCIDFFQDILYNTFTYIFFIKKYGFQYYSLLHDPMQDTLLYYLCIKYGFQYYVRYKKGEIQWKKTM